MTHWSVARRILNSLAQSRWLGTTVSRLVDGRVGDGAENDITTSVALRFSLFDFPWTFKLLHVVVVVVVVAVVIAAGDEEE